MSANNITATKKHFAAASVFILLLCTAQLFAEHLQFDRGRILGGEYWRLLSGHFVHAGWTHLVINALAALTIYFGFFSHLRIAELLIGSFFLAILISIALLIFLPELSWYRGLSGLLHGLTVYCSLRRVFEGRRSYLIGAGLVWAKVIMESAGISLTVSAWHGDMSVIHQAHLAGALLGTLGAFAAIRKSDSDTQK